MTEYTDPKQVVQVAAGKWLAATEDLPPQPDSYSDVLKMSAAWLDFYDEVIPTLLHAIGLPRSSLVFKDPSDELQQTLRMLAEDLADEGRRLR